MNTLTLDNNYQLYSKFINQSNYDERYESSREEDMLKKFNEASIRMIITTLIEGTKR